jgi:hypothetical protein
MNRRPAHPLPSGLASEEDALRSAQDEAEALRRFNESSVQFARTLQQIGAKADPLRLEMLALVELTLANPHLAGIAAAAVERTHREVSLMTPDLLPAKVPDANASSVGRQGSFGRAYAARTNDRRFAALIH